MRPLLLLSCAGVLALTGCGGSSVTGETPSGFETTAVHGAVVAHPEGWTVSQERRVGGSLSRDLTPSGGSEDDVPNMTVLYDAAGGESFKTQPGQWRTVYEEVAGGEVSSVETIDVEGADGAYLLEAELPAEGGREVPYEVRNLQVRRGDDVWIVIAERDADEPDAFDADAAIGSFRLEDAS